MPKFDGKWSYQSYRPEPNSVTATPTPPAFEGWSPHPGVLTVEPNGTAGTLEFVGKPIKLTLTIRVTDGSPGTLSIAAVMKLPGGKEFTNELHGWFVPAKPGQPVDDSNPLVVRGSIVQTSVDIAPDPQPIYTVGFFVLEPIKEAG